MEKKKNYRLNSRAVETLANTEGKEAPDYSKEELEKYRSKKRIRLPEWLKIIVVKAWFYGAVCFFFVWGLGNYLVGLDKLFVTAVAIGLVTDILINNVLRFMEKEPGASKDWMLVSAKGMGGFLLDLLYGFALMICVFVLYDLINRTAAMITGDTESIALAVEPFLFGLFCMGFDMLFVGMKRLMKRVIEDAKAKVSGSGDRDQDN